MSRETAPLLHVTSEQTPQKQSGIRTLSDVQVEVTSQQQHEDGGTLPPAGEQRHHHRHHRSASTFLVSLLSFLSGDGSDDEQKKPYGQKRRGHGRHRNRRRRHHHNDSVQTKLFLLFVYIFIVCYICIITFGPLYLSFRPKSSWCVITNEPQKQQQQQAAPDVERRHERDLFSGDSSTPEKSSDGQAATTMYANPDYNTDPCRRQAVFPVLAGMTLEDCDISRRMLVSVILGAVVGYERRSADRPAGIRTMGLVALGSCFFTICSIMAFKSSTMAWDASRVTAALPSGVGFLGGALIWKGSVWVDGSEQHQVHGLTTAASLWLSAAIGVGAGGALYAVTIYATILVLIVLRYGPTLYLQQELEDDYSESSLKDDPIKAAHQGFNTDEDLRTSMRKSRRNIPSFKG